MSLDNTLKAFSARLDEIAAHQEFIAGSLKIGRDAARFWDYTALAHAGEIKALVDCHRKGCKQVRLEDLGGALSVQLFAAVEWFIGQVLVKSVHSVSDSVDSFDKLPDAVARNHVTLTGKALSKAYEAPPHERIDVDQVFRTLSGCIHGSETFELNDYVFAFYMPNIDSNSLAKCFLRIGLELDWDKAGKNKGLQRLFGETSIRKTGKASRNFLDECARERNAVAHRGDGSATIRFEDLSKQLTFFRHLSSSIGEQVATHLASVV